MNAINQTLCTPYSLSPRVLSHQFIIIYLRLHPTSDTHNQAHRYPLSISSTLAIAGLHNTGAMLSPLHQHQSPPTSPETIPTGSPSQQHRQRHHLVRSHRRLSLNTHNCLSRHLPYHTHHSLNPTITNHPTIQSPTSPQFAVSLTSNITAVHHNTSIHHPTLLCCNCWPYPLSLHHIVRSRIHTSKLGDTHNLTLIQF